YFVNAPVDFLLIGGGSLLLYFLFLRDHALASSPRVLTLAATLVWVCNYPHFASTNYRLYRTRSNVQQYPLTAMVVPLLMLVAVVAAFASPGAVAPMFIALYLLWSPYHFSAQTLGITLVYGRRCRFSINQLERKALAGFVFLTFLVQSARAQLVGVKASPFYGITSYPTLGLHSWVPNVLEVAMWVCGGTFVVLMLWRAVRGRGLVPPIVLLPAIAQSAWFVGLVPGASPLDFFYLVPFFHSLQYLLIAWGVQMKETQDERRAVPSRRFVLGETARWAFICFVGGYALFWALPHIGAHFGRSLAFSTAVVFAVVQVHHFFVDGVIWKLKNPRVQSPTMTTLAQLTGRTRDEPRVTGPLVPVPAS
ncbi:MAG TPA: hypothetical protein VMU14_23175, partial [Acidimicrobiales bacterium]|nr:hypothetical protein [Acidimicrobiales bacterium]